MIEENRLPDTESDDTDDAPNPADVSAVTFPYDIAGIDTPNADDYCPRESEKKLKRSTMGLRIGLPSSAAAKHEEVYVKVYHYNGTTLAEDLIGVSNPFRKESFGSAVFTGTIDTVNGRPTNGSKYFGVYEDSSFTTAIAKSWRQKADGTYEFVRTDVAFELVDTCG